MPSKIKYLLLGFLSGVFVSGIIWLIVTQSLLPNNANSLPSQSEKSTHVSSTSGKSILENEGKINLNQATLEDLITLPGIGESKAASIILFRDKYGDFQAIDELLYINGISETLLDNIVPFVYLGDGE